MELRSVAYSPNPAPGMGGMMQGMQGMMPEMQGMQGMMPGMQGAPMVGGPGMYPPSGFVNLDADMDPGFVSLDLDGQGPCAPYCPPVMPHQHHHLHCPKPAPMPMPSPTPAPSPSQEVYVVKKGDSVYKIAKRYGTTMQAIILANDLRNPDLIYPGQVLIIPGVSTSQFYG